MLRHVIKNFFIIPIKLLDTLNQMKNRGKRAGKKKKEMNFVKKSDKREQAADDCVHLGYHGPFRSYFCLHFLLFQMTEMTDEF